MREIKFRAFYKGKWYQPTFVGGTQVPQVFNDKHDIVNLCAHTEEYAVCQFTGDYQTRFESEVMKEPKFKKGDWVYADTLGYGFVHDSYKAVGAKELLYHINQKGLMLGNVPESWIRLAKRNDKSKS